MSLDYYYQGNAPYNENPDADHVGVEERKYLLSKLEREFDSLMILLAECETAFAPAMREMRLSDGEITLGNYNAQQIAVDLFYVEPLMPNRDLAATFGVILYLEDAISFFAGHAETLNK